METPPHVVVLVEDEPPTREIFSMMLESAGFSVTAANDGEEALPLIQKLRPRVVITDYHMPRMDGDVLLARLVDSMDQPPRVILASADASVVERFRRDNRFFAVLQKPVAPTDLIHCVNEALG